MKTMLNELKTFYNNRNVFVTGITGFKGTWLALVLNKLGANVSGFGLKPDTVSLANLVSLNEIADVVHSDITKDNSLNGRIAESINRSNPDVVFHLAAQPLVSKGYSNPYFTYYTNIMGTVLVHELLRNLDKRISMINVTTDKVYKEGKSPRKENDRLQGFDPYSLSKSCSDMISQSYRCSFDDKMIISTMRAGNVIGGGDFGQDRIITDYILASINNKPLELRHPESVRPYQYVFDVIMGYLIQAMKQYKDQSLASEYNISSIDSTNELTTTYELVSKMNSYMDKKVKILSNGKSVGHENPMLTLDSSKFKNVSNWKPQYNNINDVVKETALWYNSYLKNNKDITINNQIESGLEKYDYKD